MSKEEVFAMSLTGLIFNIKASYGDKKRDAAIALPRGISEHRDISYGPHGESSLLDIYYPKGVQGKLPTIVSIHGGGYVYGSKEIYRRYGMDMARRGFVFVNFNYRLSPKWKFPAPLADTGAVLDWIVKNQHRYHLDPDRIILLGDSAGAQLASHYAAIHTNPDFAALFPIKIPQVTIRAVGLFCGMYDIPAFASGGYKGLARDYLGPKADLADPRLNVLDAITPQFPPAFVITSVRDFLKTCAQPMYNHLTGLGIEAEYHCYGTEKTNEVGHVFHVNIIHPEAVKCNDDAAAFFRKYTL